MRLSRFPFKGTSYIGVIVQSIGPPWPDKVTLIDTRLTSQKVNRDTESIDETVREKDPDTGSIFPLASCRF